MKSIVSNFYWFFTVILPFICSTCCNDGGNILIVDNKIVGIMCDHNGNPLDNATVIMRSRDYLSEGMNLAKLNAAPVNYTCTTTTNGKGEFFFDSVIAGTYIVEGISKNQSLIGFIDNVILSRMFIESNTRMRLDTVILKPPASIKGSVAQLGDSVKGYVSVYGFDNTAAIEVDGSFLLEKLPEGEHRLQFTITVAETAIQDTLIVHTLSEQTVIVDTALTKLGYPPTIDEMSNKILEIDEGETCTLSIVASGKPELTYLWYKDSEIVDSTSENVFIITDAVLSDAGMYRCTVQNRYGSVVSDEITITVLPFNESHTFKKMYGADGTYYAYSMQQTSDGGFIITGAMATIGSASVDVYLVKVNEQGSVLWENTYGGDATDVGFDVKQTTDGGYIIAGFTKSYGQGGDDSYLIKTDESGEELWQKTFDTTGYDQSSGVVQTADGGYGIVGYRQSYGLGDAEVYLVKLDANGNYLWGKTYGDDNDQSGKTLFQREDGGFFILGYTFNANSNAGYLYLIGTDSIGNEQWTKTLRDIDNVEGGTFTMHATDDGGYILACAAASTNAATQKLTLVKIDSVGNVQWNNVCGGDSPGIAFDIKQVNDGGYIIIGSNDKFSDGESDLYLVKTDQSGNVVWSRIFDEGYSETGTSVVQTADGGYFLSGYGRQTENVLLQIYMIKTDKNGYVD